MTPEQLFQHLKELSEKLDITLAEQSFKQVGIAVKSGYCRVKGKDMFILDRNLPLVKKNQILLAFFKSRPLNDIFVPPAVRDLLAGEKS